MKVYMRRREGKVTTFVLDRSEFWTANLDNGRDFDEKLARETVEDFKRLALEDKRYEGDYWAE